MWHRFSAFLLALNSFSWLVIEFVIIRFLVDLLSYICWDFTPVFKLLLVQLEYLEVWMLVLFLPLDWVKMCTELGQTIKLDRSDLLLAIQDIISHFVDLISLLFVLPKCDHSSPSKILEFLFYILILLWLSTGLLTSLVFIFWLLALILTQEAWPYVRDFLQHSYQIWYNITDYKCFLYIGALEIGALIDFGIKAVSLHTSFE